MAIHPCIFVMLQLAPMGAQCNAMSDLVSYREPALRNWLSYALVTRDSKEICLTTNMRTLDLALN